MTEEKQRLHGESIKPPEDRRLARKRRKRGSGAAVVLLCLAAVLFALLAAQNDALRERVVGLFSGQEPGIAVFPLPPAYSDSYTNDWGAARPQGSHEGADIYAPGGTAIYSVTSGTVTNAYGSDESGWNTLGGYTVMVEADRDYGPVRRGDRLYYAHLDSPTPLRPGDTVEAGQKIGEVGNTAGEVEGSTGDFPTHLHLGWYGGFSLFGGEREYESASSGAINPYPLLRESVPREARTDATG